VSSRSVSVSPASPAALVRAEGDHALCITGIDHRRDLLRLRHTRIAERTRVHEIHCPGLRRQGHALRRGFRTVHESLPYSLLLEPLQGYGLSQNVDVSLKRPYVVIRDSLQL